MGTQHIFAVTLVFCGAGLAASLSSAQESHPLQSQLEGVWHYVWSTGDGEGEEDEDVTIQDSVLTDAAKAYRAAFDPEVDDPLHHCRPIGMPNLTRAPFPIEIVDLGERLYFLYALLGPTRRVYLGDNGPDPDFPNQYGFSTARWDGDTLVVTTTDISEQPFIGTEALPYSGDPDAHVVERLSLEDDGNTLVNNITVVDPRYYIGGARLQSRWERSDTPIVIDDCHLASY